MNQPRIRDAGDSSALDEAVDILRSGGVVALPTETVYGLAGSCLDPKAIQSIYQLKGRPWNNPLIAHVLDVEQAQGIIAAGGFNALALELAQKFWPGPLTMVLPRAQRVPALASGGLDSIAVRSPQHPVAREILRKFGSPFSAPSANRSGLVSPTSAQHVAADFAGDALLVLDGGACEMGLESTVLDVRDPSAPSLLRRGSVLPGDLTPITGKLHIAASAGQSASPGTATRHYAPRTRVSIVETTRGATAEEVVIRFTGAQPESARHDFHLGGDPVAAGQALFATLRSADAMGAERILVEKPPIGEEWAAIADRILRASAGETTER